MRLDEAKSCILIIIGADKDGNKELVAVSDGYRESKISWKEIRDTIESCGFDIEKEHILR